MWWVNVIDVQCNIFNSDFKEIQKGSWEDHEN